MERARLYVDKKQLQAVADEIVKVMASLMTKKDPPSDRATRIRSYAETLERIKHLIEE